LAGLPQHERFERLMLPHLDAAYALALWLTRNEAQAADAVQEAFLRALRFFGLADRAAPPAAQPMRVVYHISSSDTASAALRNLANHLQAAPGVKVVVVAHNNGVDFLLRGARDESNRPYAGAVKAFSERGVEFRVCYNTLERRQIASSEVIAEATLVPSGIAEIGRLQSREGFAYMRL
jgi:intracellular sulfur oxidation DsrE/DsrF family protein